LPSFKEKAKKSNIVATRWPPSLQAEKRKTILVIAKSLSEKKKLGGY
jgi:hypothetical protein